MTLSQAHIHLKNVLQDIYDVRESTTMSDWVLEHLTGYKKSERLVHKEDVLTDTQKKLYTTYCQELLQHKPIQYVLHEAWFAGMPLYVDENVLIPRPETEELVQWVAQSIAPTSSILDIGTGSGCIPIALKKQLPLAQIEAVDVSAAALQVCARNAETQHTAVYCRQMDILDEALWPSMPVYDCIVSNPPYIKQSEQATMHNNVLQHEPHLALFVSDEDPLLFYRTITLFAQQHLTPGGALFFEINEALGNEMITLLTSLQYTSIELRKDLQGKDRMMKVVNNQ